MFQYLLLCLTLFLSSRSKPLKKTTVDVLDTSHYAHKYLVRYGYMADTQESLESGKLQSMRSAITDFQTFAGINITGQLDDETMKWMTKRRCGVKDSIRVRTKRFALQGSRWKPRSLLYKIGKYPIKSRLTRRQVDEAMKEAFSVWSEVTNLKFEKIFSGDAHIEIRFEEGNHGDDDPFDGEGGTLAHAFFPIFGGDAHFDDEEDWTVKTFRGTNLVMSAAHELGHSLGLSHSDVKSSLMAPFYRGYEANIRLDPDDIAGIQALYGEKEIQVKSVNNVSDADNIPQSGLDNKDLCRKNKVDTIVTDKNGETYVFQGAIYWKLSSTSVEEGYPRLISEDWSGLPDDLDASFTWTNGKIYFLKGSQYWRFSEKGVLDRGYPKDMSSGFAGIPNNVDAALVWSRNKKIYFFKGSQYWKLDPDRNPPVPDSYPRKISNWDGIPNNVDSAVQYSDGRSYFFKKGQYYKFDDETISVEDGDPSYPRDAGVWWFGCPETKSPLLFPNSEE